VGEDEGMVGSGMSKHDLKVRPIYHHRRESIDAHLAV
jgi:hypothetical protein